MILSVGSCQLLLAEEVDTVLLIFKVPVSSAKLLEPPLHYMLSVWGKCIAEMLRTVSAALQPILNSNKKTAQICFLSNIISLV